MLRSCCYLFTSVLVLALVGTALPLAIAGPVDHTDQMIQCAKVCADCEVQCDSSFKHCLALVTEGKQEFALCAQYCLDCSDCCELCAGLCARQGPMSAMAAELCAKCCDECASNCEKFPANAKMTDCAKACRKCAESCRDMVKQMNAE